MDHLRRKKSTLWNFFTPVDSIKAKCDLCKQIVSYKTSITNLRSHMLRRHPTINLKSVLQHPVPPATLQATTSDDVDLMQEKGDETEVLHPTVIEESASQLSQPTTTTTAHVRVCCQQTVKHFIPKKLSSDGKKKLDNLLLRMFTLDFQPFSIVEDEGFKYFVNGLNPSYDLPSRKTISTTLIPTSYKKYLNHAKEIAQSIKKLCITTDLWTSINNENFMAVTSHFIDNNFRQRTIFLECVVSSESHTSVNIATSIKRIISDWGMKNKILVVISDNATNIVNAVKDELKLKHFGCFAHTLNLIIGSALNLAAVSSLLTKVRTIVSHFKRSSQANVKLMAYQKNSGISPPKKLTIDVVMRWNSTYHMLDRFTELEDAIRATIALLNVKLPSLDAEEWRMLKQLSKILKPFEAVTKLVSGEQYMMASLVIVLTSGLVEVSNELIASDKSDLSDKLKPVVQTILQGLKSRLDNVEFSGTLSVSTFLDPRFKNIAFQDKQAEERAKKKIISLVIQKIASQEEDESQSSSTDKSQQQLQEFSAWNLFNKSAFLHKPVGTHNSRALVEVQRYLEESLVPRDEDPLKWWRDNKFNYPHLSEIVKEHFCALATSVPCERLFSKAGLALSERRTRLSSKEVQQLLSLNVNSSLLND